MAARSTHVRLENRTQHRFNLRRLEHGLSHGEWTTRPPQLIGNVGEWESESNGFATGTEGFASYQIETDEGEILGKFTVTWDNPFVGSNSYSSTALPRATFAGDDGFSSGHIGGGGDNASVTFVLLNGFCEVDSETGEVSCTSVNPLPTSVSTGRFATVFEQVEGPAFVARHGMDGAAYQQVFDALVPQGFRPTVLTGWSPDGTDRFGAVFEQTAGPAFVARHGIDGAAYQQLFDELVPQGFRPTVLAGWAANGQDRYATVFEQVAGPAFVARHGIDGAAYQQLFDELVPQGFRPTVLSGWRSEGSDRFATVFEQVAGPSFVARHGIDGNAYQQLFDELVPQGFRPTVLAGWNADGTDRYATVFEQVAGASFVARHGIDSAAYQQLFDELVPQGFRPRVLSGYL